jgi:hypothetical protein
VVEPWGFSLCAARSDNDVINALVFFECVLEKIQNRLVVSHVRSLEGRTRRLGRESRVGVDRPLLNALPRDLLSASAINVTNGNVGAVLAADLNEASSNAVGTTWDGQERIRIELRVYIPTMRMIFSSRESFNTSGRNWVTGTPELDWTSGSVLAIML